MYPALIITLKVLLALVILCRIWILYRFRKTDTNVRFKFDLISYIEIDGCIAFSAVALLAAIDERSYLSTVVLLVLSIVINVWQLTRVIVAGDKRILIGVRDFDLKEIKGMNTSWVTLHVFVHGGERLHVIVPLTLNETVRKMKYLKK